jgi:D-alanine-D-alanine ligase
MKTIAVFTGGESAEREVCFMSTKPWIPLLQKYFRVLVFDVPQELPAFFKQQRTIDLVVPILHGKGGEDGTYQGFLKTLKIPFLFADVFSHSVGMNKQLVKLIANWYQVCTAPFQVYTRADHPRYQKPSVIKPLDNGSSVGVTICKNKGAFVKGITLAFQYSSKILIEDFISGNEYTCAVVEMNKKVQALPVIQIIPEHEFYDYHSKYFSDKTQYLCPAPIPKKTAAEIQKMSTTIFQALNCYQMSRCDFIVSQRGEPYFLEINTIPGMTTHSLVPKAVAAGGGDFGQLLIEWIKTELKERRSLL